MKKLIPALAAAKAEFPPIVKNAKNPHFKSDYADLNICLATVTPILEKHGILLLQPSDLKDSGHHVIRTMLIHVESGEMLTSDYPIHPVKPGPQNEGSAVTYARRYSLLAMLAMAAQDDDGNAAQAAQTPARSTAAQQKQIVNLLTQKGRDEAKMLQWLGADAITSLTSDQAERALRELKRA